MASVETDALAEAAQRFSEAIRAERASTVEALEAERKAAVQIIEALRRENARRARASGGKFLIGFLIGALLGAAAMIVLAPRSGPDLRLGLTAGARSAGGSLGERLRAAIRAGQSAAASREQQLWSEYRQRLKGEPPRSDDEPYRL